MTEVDKLKQMVENLKTDSPTRAFVESHIADVESFCIHHGKTTIGEVFDLAQSLYISLVSTMILRTVEPDYTRDQHETVVTQLLYDQLQAFQSLLKAYPELMEQVRARKS